MDAGLDGRLSTGTPFPLPENSSKPACRRLGCKATFLPAGQQLTDSPAQCATLRPSPYRNPAHKPSDDTITPTNSTSTKTRSHIASSAVATTLLSSSRTFRPLQNPTFLPQTSSISPRLRRTPPAARRSHSRRHLARFRRHTPRSPRKRDLSRRCNADHSAPRRKRHQ